MSTIRINISLPKKLLNKIKKEVKPRKTSSFITEAISKRLNEIEKEKLYKTLEEGYKKTFHENIKIAKEFESTAEDGLND